MVGGVRFTLIGGIAAAVAVYAAASIADSANADQALAQSYFRPVPTPQFDSQSFALPFATPKFDLGAIDNRKFLKEAPELSFDTIDLGKSALRLNVVDASTRPAADTPDLTNVIVTLRPGKKRSNPRYFGLVLTTATD